MKVWIAEDQTGKDALLGLIGVTDKEGRLLLEMVEEYVKNHPRSKQAKAVHELLSSTLPLFR